MNALLLSSISSRSHDSVTMRGNSNLSISKPRSGTRTRSGWTALQGGRWAVARMRACTPLDTPASVARLSSSSIVRLRVGATLIQPATISSTLAISASSSSSSYAPSMSGYSASGSADDDDDDAIRLR